MKRYGRNYASTEHKEQVDRLDQNVWCPLLQRTDEYRTILTEEVGELARIMARTYGEQSFKESEKHRDLGDEMADVLWVLLCLANQTGVDLTAAFRKEPAKENEPG